MLEQPTPDEIRRFLLRHRLSRRNFARLLYVSKLTVDKWLTAQGSPNNRRMPRGLWELALIKCGERCVRLWHETD